MSRTKLIAGAALMLAGFLLGGCGSLGGSLGVAVDKAAQANDEGVTSAVFALCNAFSVGSIRREFGSSPDRMAIYNSLCEQHEHFNLTGGSE